MTVKGVEARVDPDAKNPAALFRFLLLPKIPRTAGLVIIATVVRILTIGTLCSRLPDGKI